MENSDDFAPSKLRAFYDLLHELSEGEQTALAQFHASKTNLLANRFEKSVNQALISPKISNLIYGELDADGNIVDNRDPLPVVTDPDDISNTDQFASFITGTEWPVEGPSGLTFSYVDRELSPLRITEKGGARPSVRWLDLLLRSEAGRPIVTELKVARDSLPYYALVQALMYAADLCGPHQFDRINQLPGAGQFTWSDDGPSVDVAVIFFNPPGGTGWTFWEDSLQATKSITTSLNSNTKVNRTVGKIVLIEGTVTDGTIAFKEIL